MELVHSVRERMVLIDILVIHIVDYVIHIVD
jgi:hypothetical protein